MAWLDLHVDIARWPIIGARHAGRVYRADDRRADEDARDGRGCAGGFVRIGHGPICSANVLPSQAADRAGRSGNFRGGAGGI